MKHCSVTSCFLYLLVVASASKPDDGDLTEATAGELTETLNRSTRAEASVPDWLDDVIVNGCQVDSLPKSPGLQNIATLDKALFFFRPGPTFRQMTFRMRLDAMLTSSPSFVVDGEIAFTAKELLDVDNTTASHEEPGWHSVIVEDYREVRKYGRDRIALRVTTAGISKNLVSNYWWRLNRYEGYDLYVEGRSQWAFSCDPRLVLDDITDPPARYEAPDAWWWVVGSGVLLLVVVFIALMIMTVRWACVSKHRQKRNVKAPRLGTPPAPPCERPYGVVNPFVIDTEHIYEDIPLNSPDAPSLPSYSTYLSATRESKIPKSPKHLAKKKSFYAFMMDKNPWFSGAQPQPETQKCADNVYELHLVGSPREVSSAKDLENPYVDMNQGSHLPKTWPLPHKLGETPGSGHVQVESQQRQDAAAHYANLTSSLR